MKKRLQPAYLPGRFRFFFLLVSFILCSAEIYAQTKTGKITDAESRPVADVTVTVKGAR
jgi:hypothetical protein